MKYILSDNGLHLRFAPLTLTRPVGALRVGIMTNEERLKFGDEEAEVFFETEDYLTTKFPSTTLDDETIRINAQVVLSDLTLSVIMALETGDLLKRGEIWVAQKGSEVTREIKLLEDVELLENRWDLFEKNARILQADFDWLKEGRISSPISRSNTIIGNPNLIFAEEDAKVEAAILNTTEGPIYLGKESEVMENAVLRGGVALCEHVVVKVGAKIYGATTFGPHCKVGGEVSNSIFQGFSNKGHDGFVGNALIGEWCNLGADTNSSNLKNNYSMVSTYSYETGKIEKTTQQFMGITMGDHSKSGINTMFNTATVCGVCCNVYGGDFPPKFIPSFSWGTAQGFELFKMEKAVEMAKAMMARRHVEFTEGDQRIFDALFPKN